MFRTVFSMFTGLIALGAVMATPAAAQPIDERVFYTFTEPVAVPGTVLQPGEYVFRLADPLGNRRVMQVLSADFRTPHAMFLVGDIVRSTPGGDYEVTFAEAPAGTARPIEALWTPGTVFGREPLYNPAERSWNRTERAVGANATAN